MSGRISSGFDELDALLLGGIPQKTSFIIAAPSSDERDFLTHCFLEFGCRAGEITIFVSVKVDKAKDLAERFPSNFHFIACNSKACTMLHNLRNVIALPDVENLTQIDIAVDKAFRDAHSSENDVKRAFIEIVSDVLLEHHALTTRKWLNELLTDLKSKGFTVLANIDPSIHPKEETKAITSLFEGEIRISEKETAHGIARNLRICKLANEEYSGKETTLTREKMSKHRCFS